MHSTIRFRSAALGLLLAVALLAAPAPVRAESTSNEALIGVGSALASLLYGPAKVLYAGGGALVGGLAWLWSGGDNDVVSPILNASLRGDYVVTPAHLRGEKPLVFIGRATPQHEMRSEPIYEEGF